MAVEKLNESPALLQEGHIVHFSPQWPSQVESKWFRTILTQQTEYEVQNIISAGSSNTYDVDFGNNPTGGVNATYMSLIPIRDLSLYEILIGLKGRPVIFFRYNNSFFNKLEASQVIPTPSDSRLKFLGGYSEFHSPYDDPRLRDYTVKDMASPVIRIFNNMPADHKLVLRFVVNRVKLHQVEPTELTPQEVNRARQIKHYEIYTY